jgi:23S rRNA pseudouridine2457 synthase
MKVRLTTGLFLLLMPRYFLFYKPYMVLSQFTSHEGKQTIGDIISVPKNIYPVGRLDYDSEGLLILTDDTSLNHRLLHPTFKHEREYWVQVEGDVSQQALSNLQQGVVISIDGKLHTTLPASAKRLTVSPALPERNPPIRFRKEIPTSWLSLTLVEGKNRQVRRMTAKVGFPTLRLVRYRIENLRLEDLTPGNTREITKSEIYTALF